MGGETVFVFWILECGLIIGIVLCVCVSTCIRLLGFVLSNLVCFVFDLSYAPSNTVFLCQARDVLINMMC